MEDSLCPARAFPLCCLELELPEAPCVVPLRNQGEGSPSLGAQGTEQG